MTRLHRLSIFLFCSLLFISALSAPSSYAQTLEQHLSTDSVKAGDVFDFSVSLKKDRPYDRVIYPDSSHFTDDIELRSRQQFHISDFKDSLRYQLQFWGVATDTIPALPVQLVINGDTTTIFTQPVPVAFQTVLQSEDEELRPLKPIFDFAAAWWPYIIGFIVFLLIAGLFYYLYKKYLAEQESEPEPIFTPQPFLNPLKELENNLIQLKDVELSTKEHLEQYYISLGDAIRLYFEQMYHIPALESTSREIIYELDRRAIDEQLVEQTRVVLREADMVKFANFTPTRQQTEKTYEKAQEFLSLAKKIHGPRINQMKSQHVAKVEQARKAFNERQNEQVE